jgi:hypothetical protein
MKTIPKILLKFVKTCRFRLGQDKHKGTLHEDHQPLEEQPAEALATFPYRSHIFKKNVRKEIISEVKGFEAWR